jgi:hypothetical protein
MNKYDLARPKIQKLADSQLVRILKGDARITEIPLIDRAGAVVKDDLGNEVMTKSVTLPTDTNTMAALSLVYERTQPAIRQHQVSVDMSFSPVDLSSYYNGSQVIDVTPEG